jgi:oligoendopeptidase F
MPRTVEARNWDEFEPGFTALLNEELTLDTVEGWLHRWSEQMKEVHEHHAELHRAKDEDTEDRAAEAAYLAFLREVYPRVQIVEQRLKEKFLALEGYEPDAEHEIFVRHFRTEVELFREENVALNAELQALANEYNKIVGVITVELGGETMTVPQAERRYLEPDREERERAWRAVHDAKLAAAGDLDALFLRLLELRRRIARNAGFRSYRDYRWRELKRFDYTPDDSRRLHDAIAEEVVPLILRVREERREEMGLERLRPWDLQVDPQGKPPLAPFATVRELEEGLVRILDRLDPELAAQFDSLRDGWLDLESRKGNVPGLGYQSFFRKSRKPYIYHSVNGTHRDVWVLLHEAGHAFHSLASAERNDLFWNFYPGTEFVEVASQSMELLTLPYLERSEGGFYSPEEAVRARREGLERTLHQLPMQAQVDAFQHWLYAEAPEDVTIDALDAKWLELADRFSPGVDWSGLERERAKGWQFYHIFAIPFYILEYSIAWLGAIQVWRSALRDPAEALRKYRAALALGGTRPLPELFEIAGASFAFDQETVGELMRFVFEQR